LWRIVATSRPSGTRAPSSTGWVRWGDPSAIGGVAVDREPGARGHQCRDPADVIGVVVGGPHRGQLEAGGCQRGLDGRGLTGIDHGGDAGVRARDQVGVVVLEAGDGEDAHPAT
jgi:hypothetical protein